MRIRSFVRRMRVSASLETAFAFFCDPANLERITPPELGFRIVSVSDPLIRLDTRIDYALRLRRVPFRWRTRISEWRPPQGFTDEALVSPYRLWRHRHRLREIEGGCEMIDEVEYALPLHPLGELAHPLVRRELARIFDFRERAIGEIFTTGGPAGAGTPTAMKARQ